MLMLPLEFQPNSLPQYEINIQLCANVHDYIPSSYTCYSNRFGNINSEYTCHTKVCTMQTHTRNYTSGASKLMTCKENTHTRSCTPAPLHSNLCYFSMPMCCCCCVFSHFAPIGQKLNRGVLAGIYIITLNYFGICSARMFYATSQQQQQKQQQQHQCHSTCMFFVMHTHESMKYVIHSRNSIFHEITTGELVSSFFPENAAIAAFDVIPMVM